MCFVMICYTKEQKHIIFYQIYKRNWGTYPVRLEYDLKSRVIKRQLKKEDLQ